MTPPLEQVGQGDASAVAACVDAYGPAVYGLARRLLGDHHDAEDMVQEIFTELWQCADRYRPGKGEPLTFVLTLARRRVIDRIRRDGRRIDLVDALPGLDPEGPATAEVDAEAASVRRALVDLSETQQRAVLLAVYGGYSHGDIAKEMALPLGTVKSHIRRGLARVASALGLTASS